MTKAAGVEAEGLARDLACCTQAVEDWQDTCIGKEALGADAVVEAGRALNQCDRVLRAWQAVALIVGIRKLVEGVFDAWDGIPSRTPVPGLA